MIWILGTVVHKTFWKKVSILEKCNIFFKTGTSQKLREHLKDKHVLTWIKWSLGVVYFEVHVCNFLILPPCSKSQQIIISFPGRFLYFCQNFNFQTSQVQILFYYSVNRKRWNFKWKKSREFGKNFVHSRFYLLLFTLYLVEWYSSKLFYKV